MALMEPTTLAVVASRSNHERKQAAIRILHKEAMISSVSNHYYNMLVLYP
jgi:hypothetical protein